MSRLPSCQVLLTFSIWSLCYLSNHILPFRILSLASVSRVVLQVFSVVVSLSCVPFPSVRVLNVAVAGTTVTIIVELNFSIVHVRRVPNFLKSRPLCLSAFVAMLPPSRLRACHRSQTSSLHPLASWQFQVFQLTLPSRACFHHLTSSLQSFLGTPLRVISSLPSLLCGVTVLSHSVRLTVIILELSSDPIFPLRFMREEYLLLNLPWSIRIELKMLCWTYFASYRRNLVSFPVIGSAIVGILSLLRLQSRPLSFLVWIRSLHLSILYSIQLHF